MSKAELALTSNAVGLANAACPCQGRSGPPQGLLAVKRRGSAGAVAHVHAVGREPVNAVELLRHVQAASPAELDEPIEVMGVRVVDLAPRERGLQRLLDGLLTVKAEDRVRDAVNRE